MDKRNFFLLLTALFVGLLIGEIIVRVYANVTNTTIASSEEKICHKNVYEHVSDEDDPYRFSPYFPDYLEYWEYYGVRPKANWSYGNVEVDIPLPNGQSVEAIIYDMNTNGQHLRGIHDVSYKKTPEKIRIAAVGDSFTWGDDVPLLFSYPAILEELIPNSEVLNFGMTAIGIDAMYFRWKYEALAFKPDVVLFTIFIDDIRRAYPCINKAIISAEEAKNGKIVITNMPPPSLKQIYEEYEEPKTYSYFFEFLLYQLRYLGGVKEIQYEYGFAVLEAILQEIKEQSSKEGTYFIVLVIESGNDHVNDAVEEAAILRLNDLLEELEIPHISANSIFAAENFTPTDYTQDRIFHFLPDGYGLLAQGISNKLEQEAIIPEQKEYFITYNSELFYLNLTNKEDPTDMRIIVPFRVE